MSVTFDICWIENQPTDVQGSVQRVIRKLRSLYLRPRIDFVVPTVTRAAQLEIAGVEQREVVDIDDEIPGIVSKNHDLYVVDYNAGKVKGDQIANLIRQHVPYGAIIFYSASDRVSIREKLYLSDVDGVFTSTREELPETAFNLVKAMVARTSLTSMRGAMVASVAEHDDLMIRCLVKILAKESSARQTEILKKAVARLKERSAVTTGKLEKLASASEVQKLFAHFAVSTVHRWYALRDHAKAHLNGLDDKDKVLELLSQFENEVINPRNDFAHKKMPTEAFSLLRKNMMLHQENLERILAALD